MSKLSLFSSPFKRSTFGINTVTTTVIVPATAGAVVRVYRLVMSVDAANTVDVQDTSGVSLIGGPWAWGAGIAPHDFFHFSGPPWFTTGVGLGLQFVTSTTANVRGVIDYLQQSEPTYPAGV